MPLWVTVAAVVVFLLILVGTVVAISVIAG